MESFTADRRRIVGPSLNVAFTCLRMLAVVGAGCAPPENAGVGGADGAAEVRADGPQLEVRCRAVDESLSAPMSLHGTIDLSPARWMSPGGLTNVTGTLRATGEGHERQRLKVRGAIGQVHQTGDAVTVDYRYVALAIERNELELESAELFLSSDGYSFLLTRPSDADGTPIRYTLDCRDSVLRLPPLSAAASA